MQREILIIGLLILTIGLWNFYSPQSLNKIEELQKKALRFFLNNYGRTYDDLLETSGYANMNCELKFTQEIYMNDILKLRNTDRLTRAKNKLVLEILKPNQITFGTRILRSRSLKIWNALP